MKTIQSFEEYEAAYAASVKDPEGFWEGIAKTFTWRKPWDETLKWDFTAPKVEWFVGGKLNITENLLDRHVAATPEKVALIWEPNDPNAESLKITYKDLLEQVCQAANALRASGVKKGDRVCLYMPMVPELLVSVLACTRVGAVHSVVFAGFSAESLRTRIQDCEANLVITADEGLRGPKTIGLKDIVDDALQGCDSVDQVWVFKRTGGDIQWQEGRDVWWHDVVPQQAKTCEAEEMDAEDPLFILYTSGSTGKPKGIVHSSAGYMVYTEFSFRNVFQYQDGDVYWCTADVGWITGHSYFAYGPMLAGATNVMFEGVPTYPDAGRFWQIVDKHQVNVFYTAPTAIRALESKGLDYVKPYDLSSLKVLGTVGEPINEEAWDWYHNNIGKGRCPIVDTWWQTETGGILISSLAGVTPEKATYATLPLPGVQPVVVDTDGVEITTPEAEGNLCMKFPWPSMLRTIWRDHERCQQTYFSTYPGKYFTGDGCRREANGFLRITGRVDDVLNVSGHRLGTAEIEDAINQHENVVESAVVGYPHNIKGQGIYAFVIPYGDISDVAAFQTQVQEQIVKMIGPIAKADKIQVVLDLPKTRSGKIMRRILRKLADNPESNLGDTSTLLNPEAVSKIKEGLV